MRFMNLLKSFAEKNDGHYTEENIKKAFSPIGKSIYQPKSAYFTIGGSKISVNLNEVGGAIPTSEPFRITLHLSKKANVRLEIYPVSSWERIIQRVFQSKNITIKEGYIFKSGEKVVKKIIEGNSFFSKLKKEKVYIRIPKENTSKIILTPTKGIDTEAQFENFISILKHLERKINSNDASRDY